VCLNNYESFDDHIVSEGHLIRAKNQLHLSKIDDIINQLNSDTTWKDKWIPDPSPSNLDPLIQFKISRDGKITQVID